MERKSKKTGIIVLAVMMILSFFLVGAFNPNDNIKLRDFYNITGGKYIFSNQFCYTDSNHTNYSNTTNCYTVTELISGQDIISNNRYNNSELEEQSDGNLGIVNSWLTSFIESVSKWNNYILKTSEGDLNVNSSDYWDSYNIPTDLTNLLKLDWQNITNIVYSDFNNQITLKEQNITNENWIEDSQEGDLNVNSSNYWDDLNTESDLTPSNFLTAGSNLSYSGNTLDWSSIWVENTFIKQSNEGNLNVNYSDNSDKLDGEEGSYYLDNVNNYVNSVGFSGTDTKTLTLGREGLSDLTASFTDRFEADTNANTECSGTNTFLSGDGTCEADENTQLDDEVPTSNVDMNNKNMTNVDCITFQSGGSICSS